MPSYRDNALDHEVNTEFMRVCKCVVPYLDRNIQKNVAIGLKLLELMNTINAYSDLDALTPSLTLTRQGNWEEDLLRSVRNSLSPEKAYMIDAIIKLQEFKSILNTKDHSSDPSSALPTDQFASFFDNMDQMHREFTPPAEAPSNPQTSQASPVNLIQALSPLLDDNQKQLFSAFAGLLNNK